MLFVVRIEDKYEEEVEHSSTAGTNSEVTQLTRAVSLSEMELLTRRQQLGAKK